MAVNFSTLLYSPLQDMFSVPVTIYPLASDPAGASFVTRGIFDTRDIDVVALDGSIISDQKTILDIREREIYALGRSLPKQGDHVLIPADCNGEPLGEYEVLDADTNGGGETTLTLRKWLAAPTPFLRVR